jgi:hypothetical protein
MQKLFNTAGPCLPEKHYMIPPQRRLGRNVRCLVIFDPGTRHHWEQRGGIETQEHDGIRIVVLWA